MHRYAQQFGGPGFRDCVFGQGAKAQAFEALRLFRGQGEWLLVRRPAPASAGKIPEEAAEQRVVKNAKVFASVRKGLYAYAKKVLEGEKFAVADGVAMLANGSTEEINFAAEVIFGVFACLWGQINGLPWPRYGRKSPVRRLLRGNDPGGGA